jgi:hypothetical protein
MSKILHLKRENMKWIVGEPGDNFCFSVIRQDGRVIALRVPTKEAADQIALLPVIRRLGEAAREYQAISCEKLPPAYKDLLDVLSKLKEPE